MRAWISQRRRYQGSGSGSASHSLRKRAWPSDSVASELHIAPHALRRAERPPSSERQVTPSLRLTRQAMVTIPASPARKTAAMTISPVSWTSSFGMNSNRASEPALMGPCSAYMKSAKKAARKTAISVPRIGRVYMARARPVWS